MRSTTVIAFRVPTELLEIKKLAARRAIENVDMNGSYYNDMYIATQKYNISIKTFETIFSAWTNYISQEKDMPLQNIWQFIELSLSSKK